MYTCDNYSHLCYVTPRVRFGVRLEQLRHREMELRYELSREDCEAIILLKGARKKFYTAAEKYKDEKHKELDKYRDEVRREKRREGERERERKREGESERDRQRERDNSLSISRFTDAMKSFFFISMPRLEIRKDFLQATPHGRLSVHLT